MPKCSVESCENNTRTSKSAYCGKHYAQILAHGHIRKRTQKDLNEIIVYEDYAEIILYDKNCKEKGRTQIDVNSVNMVKQYKWTWYTHGYVFSHSVGCLHSFLFNGGLKASRKGKHIHHIDGNKLNNRKDNLEELDVKKHVTHHLRKISKRNISGIVGVWYDSSRNKWVAEIKVNGKKIYLGRYKNKYLAIIVRKKAERTYS